MHTPVLLKSALNQLAVKKGGLYVDATFGEGGYSREILKKGGKVLAIDVDINQIKQNKINSKDLILVQGNFSEIDLIAKRNNFFPVDGVVFDLGLSMGQLKNLKRGFSYQREDEVLDMRLNEKDKLMAKDLLNRLTQEELTDLFIKYSEELNSKKIAREIINLRKKRKVEKVKDLILTIDQALGKKDERVYRRIFQALRIKVNDELNNLKKGLEGSLKILKKEGRIVVLTFHSLEDRIVKKFAREKRLRFFSKKPIFGQKKFERSAKLRTIIV